MNILHAARMISHPTAPQIGDYAQLWIETGYIRVQIEAIEQATAFDNSVGLHGTVCGGRMRGSMRQGGAVFGADSFGALYRVGRAQLEPMPVGDFAVGRGGL